MLLSRGSLALGGARGLRKLQHQPFAAHRLAILSSPCHGFSSLPKEQEQQEQESEQLRLVYEAPMGRSVRLMKSISLMSCGLTSVGMPILCMVSEQSTSVVAKWAMCGTVMLFGFGTTSLFLYLFKPYVVRMWIRECADDQEITVETVSLLSQLIRHKFLLSQVTRPEPSMHPMVSFQANGKPFFIHPECFQESQLVAKLTGGVASDAANST